MANRKTLSTNASASRAGADRLHNRRHCGLRMPRMPNRLALTRRYVGLRDDLCRSRPGSTVPTRCTGRQRHDPDHGLTMRDPIHSKQYQQMRAELKTIWKARNEPCWICGQATIDWDGPANAQDSFELEHPKPRKHFPHLALDRANAKASHGRCNRSKGAGDARPGIGTTSEAW